MKGLLVLKDGFYDEAVTVRNKSQRYAVQENEEAKSEGFSLSQKTTGL